MEGKIRDGLEKRIARWKGKEDRKEMIRNNVIFISV